DQYVVKILAPRVFSEVITRYDSLKTFNKQVQLGIELGQAIPRIEVGTNRKAIKILLGHPNLHVVQQSLINLTDRIESTDSLYTFVQDRILDSDRSPFVWLQALNLLAASDPKLVPVYSDRLDKISKEHPYLYPQVLDAWMKVEDSETFLNRIEQTITVGDPLMSMYAVNGLNEFWSEVDNKNEVKSRVRKIIFDALTLADRGVTYTAQPLLQKSILFKREDFDRINGYLNAFSLPDDIEVYQTFGTLYKEQFEEQARPVIDSLASLNYPPLNRSLKQAGWDVDVSDDIGTEFRTPNWDRLWQLGEHPVWVLETKKGTIKVEMHTLSAPATVSAIDSLTRAGAYDGIPFHRVVPNFVIQGGDIEREDGFGGPDFTIPTEASELEYFRGAAGIASAGPDTEGSQYFFMHQWKPHLNGRYTLFGRVIEGMDVVDRIIAGDKVINAYWK
ncbi:MAG: peptidylprolyl isomerase, partial [Balneolaceae bacterium]|nr:peptidylprolyl isomerase [Balneolaceae bacterium]